MKETVKNKLKEIEEKEGVRILHCVESGSRAWGFASPDSDYDVRFVYLRPREHYLRLDGTRDVIEWQLDDTLDVNGWDLQKTLRLLHHSNPTVFEWDASPIVYQTTEEWQRVSAILKDYFSPKSGLYHYLHTAKCNYRDFLQGEQVKLKKYFYVLRPLLACRWILKEGTPPPVPFDALADRYLAPKIAPVVEDLLTRKRETPEFGTGARIDPLNEFLLQEMDDISAQLNALPKEVLAPWPPLNELFRSLLEN